MALCRGGFSITRRYIGISTIYLLVTPPETEASQSIEGRTKCDALDRLLSPEFGYTLGMSAVFHIGRMMMLGRQHPRIRWRQCGLLILFMLLLTGWGGMSSATNFTLPSHARQAGDLEFGGANVQLEEGQCSKAPSSCCAAT
jgi:hypothetical protein